MSALILRAVHHNSTTILKVVHIVLDAEDLAGVDVIQQHIHKGVNFISNFHI